MKKVYKTAIALVLMFVMALCMCSCSNAVFQFPAEEELE